MSESFSQRQTSTCKGSDARWYLIWFCISKSIIAEYIVIYHMWINFLYLWKTCGKLWGKTDIPYVMTAIESESKLYKSYVKHMLSIKVIYLYIKKLKLSKS